jgi:signal transduction histidine kinase/ligand-binding sensor domain-containing protein
MSRRIPRAWIAAGIGLWLAWPGAGRAATWWRSFKALDGMAEAACAGVTATVRGEVIVRHRRTNAVSRLDGYTVQVVDLPARAGSRVWAWHTGQLWTAAAGGVFLYSGTNWTWIRIQAGPVNPDTPIRPVRTGRLLVLLPDRLLVLQVTRDGAVEVETVQTASALALGRLWDLWVGRDGNLWISAERGLARANVPARSVRAGDPWQRWELPVEWGLADLQGLTEDALGHLVMTASTKGQTRVALQFDGSRWQPGPDLPQGAFRVWHGPGDDLWSLSENRLWRFDASRREWVHDESCPAREFYDVAPAPDGTFWLATLDGLLKYSPPLWQPVLAPVNDMPVLALAEAPDGMLWLARPDRLDGWDGLRVVSRPLPEGMHPEEGGALQVWAAADGYLWIQHGGRAWVAGPGDPDWIEVRGPGGEPARALGRRHDGTLVVQTEPAAESADPAGTLWRWRAGQWEPFPVLPPASAPAGPWTAYLQTRSGDEWLAARTGMIRIRQGREQGFLMTDLMEADAVELLAEGPDGRVYAGGREQVWCWDEREWTLVWSGSGPLRTLGCTRDGSLWVISAEGVFRRTDVGWIGHGPDEGLPAATLHGMIEDRRGRLWLATGRGLYGWHPEADRDPPQTELNLPESLTVPEGSLVTLGLRGWDRWKFTPTSRLLYSYRLNEGDWSPAQESTVITWNDLPAGRYVVQVRTVDRAGNVERRPAQREFHVRLPWYREPRLVGVAVTGALGVLFFAGLALNRHRRLRRSYAEVERQVAERTRQLESAYQELLESQKMRALGTLAAGVAHDFNNLLSIIKGSVQVIEDHMDDPVKVRRRLERIKAMVEQGTRVVQAMLGFSRASAGQFERLPLNQVVHDTLALLGEPWRNDCQVTFEPGRDLPPVPMIRDLVQQSLLNLLFNAAEAGGPTGQIIVRTRRLRELPPRMVLRPADAPEYVEVSVQDFGCGIRPEDLTRIWEPFFTTKALSSRRGTGLGLTMVYEMTKRLGGGLAVESQPGQGSTFRLILPVPPMDSGTLEPATREVAGPGTQS